MLEFGDTSTPVVVLRSDSHGGLNIMRSLGRLGVPVYNVDPNPLAPAFHSRYCQGKFLWDIEHRPVEESLDYLAEVCRTIGRPSILIPTTDRTARFVADHAQTLVADFIFPDPPNGLVQSLASKREMFHLARQHGIPTPDALFPASRADVTNFINRARFPIMLKGIDGQRLWDRTGKKMFIARSEDELLTLYDAVEDWQNPNLMLQEYIPGDDNAVWMFNGYFNAKSDCLVGFTGKKIRQCPIHTGSTSLGICLNNKIVQETTKRFMKAICYRGALDIGYRFDTRDSQYKVLDVNPRIGATFRLFVGTNGIDVAQALYLDLTGQRVVSAPLREGRKWIVEDLDFVSCCRYYHEGTLRIGEWVRSYRGIEETAFVSFDDPLPIFAMLILRAGDLIRRAFRAGRGVINRTRHTLKQSANETPTLNLSSRTRIPVTLNRKTR